MLYRKFAHRIEEFLKDEPKKILLINGARQIGKSYLIRYVGKKLFKNYIEINLKEDKESIGIFETVRSTADFYLQLGTIAGNKLGTRDNTLVFLDEIQHVENYEKVVDSLYVRDGIDLYITGSTADLLSSEIASRLTGRYVEINVLPLSFREYASNRGVTDDNAKRLFADYIAYGGLPGSLEFANGSSAQREYIESVFKTIIEKDVLKRSRKGRFLVERIIRYMTANVGNLTSAKRLTDRLADESNYSKSAAPAYNTVVSYLERLTDCFFFYKSDRFDVRGGEYLKQINKYYLTDFGFKYYILHNPTLELQQLVENVVYLELKRRRYKVATGKVDDKEVDFVIQEDDGRIRYIQVAVSVADEAKLKQELAVFASIQDNHPKYLMTLDEIFVADHAGIRTLNVIDFLLGRQAFD